MTFGLYFGRHDKLHRMKSLTLGDLFRIIICHWLLDVLASNKQSKYVMQCGMHPVPKETRQNWIHKADHKLNTCKLKVKFRPRNGLNNKSEFTLLFNNDIEVYQAQSECFCFQNDNTTEWCSFATKLWKLWHLSLLLNPIRPQMAMQFWWLRS